MFGEVWKNIEPVRNCDVLVTFCKHFPYNNLNFIINLQASEKVAINKRAAAQHEDTSAFSSAGSLLFRRRAGNVPPGGGQALQPRLRSGYTRVKQVSEGICTQDKSCDSRGKFISVSKSKAGKNLRCFLDI